MRHSAALLAPLILLINACASVVNTPQTDLMTKPVIPAQAVDLKAGYWWRYAVHLTWPESQEPNWYMDLYLADQLFAPILHEYSSKLPLWRFHRRAVRDKEGHRFTFLFYSDVELAGEIYANIDKRYQFLKSIGFSGADFISKSDLTNPSPAGIAMASDSQWYIEIRKTWPYFIKGVCESWLHLVQNLSQQALTSSELPNFEAMTMVYQQVEKQVNRYWRNQGGHAYLHHLNAIFGFEDVIITERKLMRF